MGKDFTHEQKNRIKAALDQIVAREHPNPAKGCHAYAVYGSLLLNYLTGGVHFQPQGGGRGVRIGEDPESRGGCLSYTLDPEKHPGEVHYWIATRQGEIIDFTTCFIKAEVLETGRSWDRRDLPAFVWQHKDGIWDEHGLGLIVNRQMTEAVITGVLEILRGPIPRALNAPLQELATIML
jgi:hypothetical protein